MIKHGNICAIWTNLIIILLGIGSHDLLYILLLHATFHRNVVLLGQCIAVWHALSYFVLHLSKLIVHYHGVHVINDWLLRNMIKANVIVGPILVLIVEEWAFWDYHRFVSWLLLKIELLLVILLHTLILQMILISHLSLLLLLIVSTIWAFVILHLLRVKHALLLLLVMMVLLLLLVMVLLLTLRPSTIDLIAWRIEHHWMLYLLLLLLLLHLLLLLIHWDQHRIIPIGSSLRLNLLVLIVLRVTISAPHDYLRGVLGRVHRSFHTVHAVRLLDILHINVRVTIRRISIIIFIDINAMLAWDSDRILAFLPISYSRHGRLYSPNIWVGILGIARGASVHSLLYDGLRDHLMIL